MSEGYYRVKNFEKYQHYKDRNPPWIKLYNSLLSDFAFSKLDDATKYHLIAIWLLASRLDNRIPEEIGFIAQQTGAKAKVNLPALVSGGFLEHYDSDGVLLAACKQSARPEAEREKRRVEKETQNSDDGFSEFWDAWPRHHRKANMDNCLAHWRAKRLAQRRGEIVAAVGSWKASRDWMKDDGQYIPAPLPWLRQGRWENPPMPTTNAQPFGRPLDFNDAPFPTATPDQIELAKALDWEDDDE